jgi:hypothetical protein
MKLPRLIALTTLVVLGGCADLREVYAPPEPWERDLLAQEKMLIGGHPAEAGTDDHIYFSKEAASIGRTIGGGGCGCN